VDFIVELAANLGEVIPYFFVPVKTTRLGYTALHNRLVEVKARRSLQAKPLADETYKIDLATVAFPRDLPFPLCIFMFDMENDEGYYRWLLSPQITNEGEPKVLLNQENAFRKLSRDELDTMIRLVNDWYEKRTALTFA
jgi:hypothetical protein